MTENPDDKRKIGSIEHKDGEGNVQQNVAYINEQRQEFEIEYGVNGQAPERKQYSQG